MNFSEFLQKKDHDFSIPEGVKEDYPAEKNSLTSYTSIIKHKKQLIKDIINLLKTDEYEHINIIGSAGTGKTSLLNVLKLLTEQKVLTFYYECSQANGLDDIMLSLFNYLKKVTVKDSEYIKSFRISTVLSIDERLINRLKKLEKPLLIIVDGLENILGRESEAVELIDFLGFISKIPTIKIITAGKESLRSHLKNKIHTIKLEGLSRDETSELIQEKAPIIPENMHNDIFNLTSGCPENIILLATVITNSLIPPDEILSRAAAAKNDFQNFITEQIYGLITEKNREIINFLALSRHSFPLESLKKLDKFNDVEEKIKYLSALNILSENNGGFQLKQRFKDYIINQAEDSERVKIHDQLYKIYSSQIPVRLEERFLPVSRRLLYSEQYYHYKKMVELGAVPHENAYAGKNDPKQDVGTVENKMNFNNYLNENREIIEISDTEENSNEIKLSEQEKMLVDEETQEYFSGDNQASNIIDESGQNENESVEEKDKQLEQTIEEYNEKGDLLQYSLSLFKQANLHKEHFRHDQALRSYYSILNSIPANFPVTVISEIYVNIGEIYDYRGDFNFSRNYYMKALQEAKNAENINQVAKIYFKLALSYDDTGDYNRAIDFYQRNINTSDNPQKNLFLAASCSNMADIYEEQGNPVQAIEFYKKSLEIDSDADNLEGEYDVLSRLGNVYFDTGNYSEAEKCFRRELKIAKQLNDPYKIAMSCIDMGDIFLYEKNYEKAVKAFIMAKKSIDKTISTDSKEKINRKFQQIIKELGENRYNEILRNIRTKHA